MLIMLCHVLLCYVMLFYVMLYLHYVMLMVQFIISYYIISYYIILYYFVLYHIISYYTSIILYHIIVYAHRGVASNIFDVQILEGIPFEQYRKWVESTYLAQAFHIFLGRCFVENDASTDTICTRHREDLSALQMNCTTLRHQSN